MEVAYKESPEGGSILCRPVIKFKLKAKICLRVNSKKKNSLMPKVNNKSYDMLYNDT